MSLYNLGIYIFVALVKLAALFSQKARLWVVGRKDWRKRLRSAMDGAQSVVWVHAASLGEFEQGRPLIEAIRAECPHYKIVLTFFSPSGYEIRKNYDGADYVCYLPADTRANAKDFVSIVKPEIAIFIKYEFWLNYLTQLHKAECRTFIVSTIFRRNSVFFKWYGGIFRRVLGYFSRIFVQNQESVELLSSIGVERVTLAGDTRFDRVADIARSAKSIELVERFAKWAKVLVAGSTWPADEALLERLIAQHPQMKFIIAPHEIDSDRIDAMIGRIGTSALRYTRCDAMSDLEGARLLVIDTIGILSSVYRYAEYAYIGGGFGAGIHNILEAATFGLPISFGPNYFKFKEARDLIVLGSCATITDFAELNRWLVEIESDENLYKRLKTISEDYINENIGSTRKIINKILKDVKKSLD